jgi:hypothetical protein
LNQIHQIQPILRRQLYCRQVQRFFPCFGVEDARKIKAVVEGVKRSFKEADIVAKAQNSL